MSLCIFVMAVTARDSFLALGNTHAISLACEDINTNEASRDDAVGRSYYHT